jgi:Cu2+-exporting ATPase
MRHQNQISEHPQIHDATIYVEDDTSLLGAIWLDDALKADTLDTIEQLRFLKQSILSGDSQANVEAVSNMLNIPSGFAQCSPEDKLDAVRSYQAQGDRILMLGDGINDSPVLAQANVSVSVGNASDLAKNASDILFLQPSIASLPLLLALAQRCKIVIKQNFMWALGYNLLILPFGIAGFLTPWMAALGMSLSSIIVVYNSSRLLKFESTRPLS